HVKETRWLLLLPYTWQNVHFKLRKVNDHILFDLRWIGEDDIVEEGGEMMFKLDDGTIVTFKAKQTYIPCMGCGATGITGSKAMGIVATYKCPDEEIKKFEGHYITKMRFYFSGGYDDKKVPEECSDRILDAFDLMK
ncbi:MAG: hypothetical protein ACTHKV_14895, partial [Flavipsychrobacter sp.]